MTYLSYNIAIAYPGSCSPVVLPHLFPTPCVQCHTIEKGTKANFDKNNKVGCNAQKPTPVTNPKTDKIIDNNNENNNENNSNND